MNSSIIDSKSKSVQSPLQTCLVNIDTITNTIESKLIELNDLFSPFLLKDVTCSNKKECSISESSDKNTMPGSITVLNAYVERLNNISDTIIEMLSNSVI